MSATSTLEPRTTRRPASAAPRLPRQPGAGRAGESSSRRRRLVSLAVVAIVLALLAGAAFAVVTVRNAPVTAGVGSAVPVAGLDLTVVEFSRRIDAAAGVNTEKMPLSGPAMPMGSMNGMPGMGADDAAHSEDGTMPPMPGMAGMLEKGQERVDVSVAIRNGQDDAVKLDAARFQLFSNGTAVPLLQPTASDLTAPSVPPGFTTSGMLTFVIPEGTAPLELRYDGESSRVVLGTSAGAAEEGSQAPHGDAHP